MNSHPTLSSSHPESQHGAETAEFEYGLIVAGNAFHRWVVRCMTAAGLAELSSLEVLLLHSVNHRARDKSLSDIGFVLNIEDTHIVNYGLKKLLRLGLVERGKRGKEVTYRSSDAGQEAVRRYREIREDCLIRSLESLGTVNHKQIGDAANLLRALSGLYDQAARAATSASCTE
ncbi:winged helix DNA-binding protein [Azospirillum doebereinerae]